MLTDAKETARALKESHVALLQLLEEISKMVMSRQLVTRKEYLSLRPELRSLQVILLNHFQKQNQMFYDSLKQVKGAEHNIVFLVEDLKELKICTLVFFDEHPADMGDINPKNFKSEYFEFSQRLIERLRNEELILIPLILAAN